MTSIDTFIAKIKSIRNFSQFGIVPWNFLCLSTHFPYVNFIAHFYLKALTTFMTNGTLTIYFIYVIEKNNREIKMINFG